MIDLEATMSTILRADPDVSAVVADRVWLTMPAKPTFPAVMLRRVGGAGQIALQGKRMYDAGTFDIHVYGGSRAEALTLTQHVLDALCEATSKLTVQPVGTQRIPDASLPQELGRDRERYISTVAAAGR